MTEKNEKNNWFKHHADTLVVVGAILTSALWMTSQIHNIDNRLTVIETVLVVKNIMPKEICKKNDDYGFNEFNK